MVRKKANKNTIANLDKAATTMDKLTDDGLKHKQGDVVTKKAFGVTIKTKF